jgi:hypothetical protein
VAGEYLWTNKAPAPTDRYTDRYIGYNGPQETFMDEPYQMAIWG